MSIKPLLVLGASSYIGRYFLHRLRPNRAVGTYHSHRISGGIRFNILNDPIDHAVNLGDFSHAILLLGDTDVNRCATDIAYSDGINVHAMKKVIDTLIRYNIHITFASTESVFDGRRGNWQETDTPKPILTYSKQKYIIEQYLSEHSINYLIIRFGKVYGALRRDGTLFTRWIEHLHTGKPVVVAYDQKFCPIWIEDLVTSVLLLIEKNAIGIFHIAGPRGLTRKELFEMILACVKRVRGVIPKVTYCSIDDFPLLEKRPHDVTLSIEKFVQTTGFIPRDPEDLCTQIVVTYPYDV